MNCLSLTADGEIRLDDVWQQTECGIFVPASIPQPSPARPVAVDLFAGCGGFSLGMEAGGFDVLAAVEWDPWAACSYAYNLGDPDDGRFVFVDSEAEHAFRQVTGRGALGRAKAAVREPEPLEPGYFGANRRALCRNGTGCRAVIVSDVRRLSGSAILEAAGLQPGQVDLVCGGPPCQGFSRAGRQDPADPRSNLVLEFLRLVGELAPRCWFMENVPPLFTDKKFRPLWTAFVGQANDLGYDVVANILDASHYGVPQCRRRLLVFGSLSGRPTFQFPMPSHWGFGARADGSAWNQLDRKAGDSEPEALDEGQFDLFGSAW